MTTLNDQTYYSEVARLHREAEALLKGERTPDVIKKEQEITNALTGLDSYRKKQISLYGHELPDPFGPKGIEQ